MIDCIDTSAILDAWVRYYPPDVFPAVWKNLEAMIEADELIAPEEVLHEIEKKEDELHKWAKAHEGMFHLLDEAVQRATTEILIQFPRLMDSEKERNRSDPFVIALAKIKGCPVVTGEKAAGTQARPKIPIVCNHFGVRYLKSPRLDSREEVEVSLRAPFEYRERKVRPAAHGGVRGAPDEKRAAVYDLAVSPGRSPEHPDRPERGEVSHLGCHARARLSVEPARDGCRPRRGRGMLVGRMPEHLPRRAGGSGRREGKRRPRARAGRLAIPK